VKDVKTPVQKALSALWRAEQAQKNRIARGAPSTYAQDKARKMRIAELRAKYEALLRPEHG